MTNINFNGGNFAGIQVGDGVNNQTVTQNNGPAEPTPEAVFDAVAKALPESSPDVVQSIETAEAHEAVQELRTIAIMPPAEQDTPSIKTKAAQLLTTLIPYAPQIGKGLAVFGAAALDALATRNPIVAGVLALCKANAAGQ